ncbi:MAG: capsid protein [Bacilli bacterium]|nr:capsid protein [Bacilli bacterium]
MPAGAGVTNPTALNYAEKYQRALANQFPYVLYFGDLYNQTSDGNYKWVDEKTIKIPRLTTTGRVNANRDTIGTAARNYDNSWETKTLEHERKWSTLVHPMDIKQTNIVASIANITKTFNEFQKFPEMDAYLISKLYERWTTTVSAEGYTGKTADTTALTTGDAVLAMFDKFMLAMDNARVPVTGRILYCTHEVKALLKNAASIAKRWEVQQSGGAINRAVEYLDGVKVNAVPKELMKTAYNFTEGWTPATTAGQIDMWMVHKGAIITPISYTFAQLSAPSALSEGKYVYYEESFEDAFILNNRADALQFHVTT